MATSLIGNDYAVSPFLTLEPAALHGGFAIRSEETFVNNLTGGQSYGTGG